MRRGVVLTAVLAVSIATWYAVARTALLAHSVVAELDKAKALAELSPRPQATIVYDKNGKPAFTFFVEQRTAVPIARVSPQMIDAIIAVEDRRFFSHHGIDPIRVAGAAWRNFRVGRIVEGGSTITQQLARASLSSERTYDRKIREVLLFISLLSDCKEVSTPPRHIDRLAKTIPQCRERRISLSPSVSM